MYQYDDSMYLKDTGEFPNIKDGLKQTFQNKFTSSIARHEILKMKNEGILKDRDLYIADFLFKFRFATLNQIYRYLDIVNMLTQKENVDPNTEVQKTSLNSIKSRLEKLIQYRIINKFMLGVVTEDRPQPDAQFIYCLDSGGKFLLNNYSNVDTSDWNVTTNFKTSCLIAKDIISVEFYLNLLKTSGKKLVYYENLPLRKCDKTNIIPSFEFCLKEPTGYRYFICQVVRESDYPMNFSNQIEKLERLLETNAWRKYYSISDNQPILFLIAPDLLLAKDICHITSNQTSIEKYRVSTYDDIQCDLSTAFYKYIKESNELKKVIAKIF